MYKKNKEITKNKKNKIILKKFKSLFNWDE
jgi:hypothetical protein